MKSWFRSDPIRRQITALAIGPVILLALIGALTEPLTLEKYESSSYAETTSLKIETVVEQVRMSDSPEQIAAILDAVDKTGLRVELVPAAELHGLAQEDVGAGDVRRLVQADLPASLEPILREDTAGTLDDVLVVRVDAATALAFAPLPAGPDALIIDRQVNAILITLALLLPVMLLAFYAGCVITAPLSRFAAAAQTLSPEEGEDRPFDEAGSLEVRTLAKSLNDMRSRTRRMIDDRTRMLRAISHDLRTPLTRLRLRAEQSQQPELRDAMLRDISRIVEMIEETLAYLSKNVSAEEWVKADLPSLLGTVCSDFADIGFTVAYEGPERLAYRCKPQALTRAISNLLDNGTKFAGTVSVRLSREPGGAVRIAVSDDGPGVPAEIRGKVLEPFFKASAARTVGSRGGFGLGLSIVSDIVRSHGGSMQLVDNDPTGLTVLIDLPASTPRASEPAAHKRSLLARTRSAKPASKQHDFA